jgi:hypothetical protein
MVRLAARSIVRAGRRRCTHHPTAEIADQVKDQTEASPGASRYVATVTQMLPKAATMRSGE